MVVKADLDVVFLDQLLDRIDGVHRFRGDGVQAHGLGELEDLAGLGLVFGNAHHAVIHRRDLAGGELVFDLLDGLGRGVVVPLHIGLLLAQLLAGIELDDFAAGLGGLLDGFKHGEVVEGIGLAADEEPAGLAVLGDLVFGAQREGRGQGDGGATDAESEKVVLES